MDAKDAKMPSGPASLDPILELNEFEEEAESSLRIAKEESSRIIQEAKVKATEFAQKEKALFTNIEDEYAERVKKEVDIERRLLVTKAKEELQAIESIPDEKIKKAASYILERILPKSH